MSKLAILECELIIGDKRCVEINMDANGNSEFVWVDKNSGVQQTYVDENGQRQTYLKKTFSLGVNPKIGDYIVGDEFPLQNTISYTQNIDAEGTAIPIKMSDHLSGSVEFRILGPVNQTWNDITRRHPSFWRHTSWGEASMSVLSHTENIWIKDFECKIYTDAGGSTSKNKNLCYCSNMTQKYISSKDDITFELVTQLTADEGVLVRPLSIMRGLARRPRLRSTMLISITRLTRRRNSFMSSTCTMTLLLTSGISSRALCWVRPSL